jgi:hypothetical protein
MLRLDPHLTSKGNQAVSRLDIRTGLKQKLFQLMTLYHTLAGDTPHLLMCPVIKFGVVC